MYIIQRHLTVIIIVIFVFIFFLFKSISRPIEKVNKNINSFICVFFFFLVYILHFFTIYSKNLLN